MSDRYGYQELKLLMSRLRDPKDGCSWDRNQTFESVVPHTLEEVYEVIDTIERGDYAHLSEELGDLLFQIVFYAQIATENHYFNLDEVIHNLVRKLILRHPHVFPEGTLDSRNLSGEMPEDGVSEQWEKIKDEEKQQSIVSPRILADTPKALPGLLRAKKLQKKAARVGFDWPNVDQVIEKAYEELAELEGALKSGDVDEIESELGDLLFVLANVARHRKIDPERAVRRTNQKFERRFGYVEDQVKRSGRAWHEFDLAALDRFWDEAKLKEKSI